LAQEIRVSVTVHLHKTHRRFTAGKERVDIEGQTVGECLRNLVDLYPELKPQLFDGGVAASKYRRNLFEHGDRLSG